MAKKSAILHFGHDLVERPIISDLIRNHDVSVNILQASITPEEDGTMFVQIEGTDKAVKKAFDYLKEEGVGLIFPAKNLIWDKDKCTDCGACVAQCLVRALTVNESKKLDFDSDKCIACGLCIPACPYHALESVTDHLS